MFQATNQYGMIKNHGFFPLWLFNNAMEAMAHLRCSKIVDLAALKLVSKHGTGWGVHVAIVPSSTLKLLTPLRLGLCSVNPNEVVSNESQ